MTENKSVLAKLLKTIATIVMVLGFILSLARTFSNQETQKYRIDRIEQTNGEMKQALKEFDLRQDSFDNRIEDSDKVLIELRVRLEYLIKIVEDSKDEK